MHTALYKDHLITSHGEPIMELGIDLNLQTLRYLCRRFYMCLAQSTGTCLG